jgi:hypothetical protein
MRQLFGIITALTTALLIIFMAQFVREGIYPYPTGINADEKDVAAAWTKALPLKGQIIMIFSHAMAAFAAAFITSLTVGIRRMTLGLLSICIVIFPLLSYAYLNHFSLGFIAVDVCIMIILGFIGALTGSNRYDM